MSFSQKIDEDLKQALLSRDSQKADTLRMLKSAIKNQEIALGHDLSEEESGQIVVKEVKKREEAITEYKKGNRQDLVDSEQKEAEILKKYMPEQLDDQKIEEMVNEAISETNAQSMADMGKVMAAVMPKVAGKADGSKVSNIVKSKLTS